MRRNPSEVLHDDLGRLRLAGAAFPADNDGLVRGPRLPSLDVLFSLALGIQVPLHLSNAVETI